MKQQCRGNNSVTKSTECVDTLSCDTTRGKIMRKLLCEIIITFVFIIFLVSPFLWESPEIVHTHTKPSSTVSCCSLLSQSFRNDQLFLCTNNTSANKIYLVASFTSFTQNITMKLDALFLKFPLVKTNESLLNLPHRAVIWHNLVFSTEVMFSYKNLICTIQII